MQTKNNKKLILKGIAASAGSIKGKARVILPNGNFSDFSGP